MKLTESQKDSIVAAIGLGIAMSILMIGITISIILTAIFLPV